MKLFTKQDKIEGLHYPRAVFNIGNCIASNKIDGWYIKIELPLKLYKPWLNPHTYLFETRKCNWILIVRKRKIFTFSTLTAWYPINEF